MLLSLLLAAAAGSAPGTAGLFDQVKASIFTVEVHSGNQEAKHVLGSGYLVSNDGLIVTNYHVVGSYIDDPVRFAIRVRNHSGEHTARLVRFDLENDLALLRADGIKAPPLPLAAAPPAPGESIVAFGNPEGLGLSLIEGISNGFAAKGVVDRMLLSMPLNSGMSGGPVMSERREVVGTNVSVMWLSNSLSFAVPVAKVHPLLSLPPLETTKAALLEETHRQLEAVERTTLAKLAAGARRAATIAIGAAQSQTPPDAFDCWDSVDESKDEGLTRSRYGCNLQFTPMVEGLGEVGSVELLIEHLASRDSTYGFYKALEDQAPTLHEVVPRDPSNGTLSAPVCESARVRAGELVFKVNTCLNAYVKHPGFFNFDLVATSVTRARESISLAVHMKGFRFPSFRGLTSDLLAQVGFRKAS